MMSIRCSNAIFLVFLLLPFSFQNAFTAAAGFSELSPNVGDGRDQAAAV
jgi:hypothetical protein